MLSMFGGTRKGKGCGFYLPPSCLLKPGETVNNTERYKTNRWINYEQPFVALKEHQNYKKEGRTNKQYKIPFFFVTMLHHIQQNRFTTRWEALSSGVF